MNDSSTLLVSRNVQPKNRPQALFPSVVPSIQVLVSSCSKNSFSVIFSSRSVCGSTDSHLNMHPEGERDAIVPSWKMGDMMSLFFFERMIFYSYIQYYVKPKQSVLFNKPCYKSINNNVLLCMDKANRFLSLIVFFCVTKEQKNMYVRKKKVDLRI